MPLYSYECPKCGAVKELLRSLKEKDDSVLCDADTQEMTSIIGGVFNIRKGAGIYSMDIKSDKLGDYE